MMARDVLGNGYWLLPEICGVLMLNKPPLHVWLMQFVRDVLQATW
jgi:4-amino-4-deoxy-L-arabinose transferase-like glycosyltransferase